MQLDIPSQAKMVDGLLRPEAFPHPAGAVRHLQTHISHVLLAGRFAYKIKKALNLGFLDFSTLQRRKDCCDEELRLNSRLAPSLYLAVVPITGHPEAPRIGGDGPVLDYAVRMRRFSQSALLSRRPLSPSLIDDIAARVAAFHLSLPAAEEADGFGTPSAVLAPMLENFRQIRPCIGPLEDGRRLEPLEAWTRARHAALAERLRQRLREGHVRECHGDMHLGNMALVSGQLAIFDGIDFNPQLRWIDTMSEVAFLVMDLQQSGRSPLAWRFLNDYLERGGDYAGMPVLNLYRVYRALVRAKVSAIRLRQVAGDALARQRHLSEYRRYIDLAEAYTQTPRNALIITHGVSGSGKTRLSRQLAQTLGAVHLRSDVERKRLHGLQPTQDSGSATGAGIYGDEATRQTYLRLQRLADDLCGAGFTVLVDATFLQRSQRQAFQALAKALHRPFLILDCSAPEAVLKARIRRRKSAGADASEADEAVLARQLLSVESFSDDERPICIHIDTTGNPPIQGIRERIDQLAGIGRAAGSVE